VALGLALRELQNIHPVPTVLDRGRIVFSRRNWNGVHPCTYLQGVLWYGVNPGPKTIEPASFPHRAFCRSTLRLPSARAQVEGSTGGTGNPLPLCSGTPKIPCEILWQSDRFQMIPCVWPQDVCIGLTRSAFLPQLLRFAFRLP